MTGRVSFSSAYPTLLFSQVPGEPGQRRPLGPRHLLAARGGRRHRDQARAGAQGQVHRAQLRPPAGAPHLGLRLLQAVHLQGPAQAHRTEEEEPGSGQAHADR